MKAHFLFIAVALIMTGGQIANAQKAQVRQVIDVKPSDDPNASDRAKFADMQKNGPSCPLINGSSANRDANTNTPTETARSATNSNTLE